MERYVVVSVFVIESGMWSELPISSQICRASFSCSCGGLGDARSCGEQWRCGRCFSRTGPASDTNSSERKDDRKLAGAVSTEHHWNLRNVVNSDTPTSHSSGSRQGTLTGILESIGDPALPLALSAAQSRDPLFVHISQLQIDDDRVFASAWNRKYFDEAINEFKYGLEDLQLQVEVLSQEIQCSEEEFQTGLFVQRDDRVGSVVQLMRHAPATEQVTSSNHVSSLSRTTI